MRSALFFTVGVFVWFMLPQALAAQLDAEATTGSRRARRAYEQATEAWRRYDHQTAVRELERAVAIDDTFIQAYLLLAEVRYQQGDYELSIAPWQSAIKIDSLYFPAAYYYLGEAFLRMGRYAEAKQAFTSVLAMDVVSETLLRKSRDNLAGCRFALEAIRNPVDFVPINPGPAINSPYAEYSPALTADEKTLVFTRKKPFNPGAPEDKIIYFEDFYISYFTDGSWTEAKNLGPPINTTGNEGAQTMTADGRHLYFTACNRPDAFGSCDIYYAERRGGRWTEPVNAGRMLNSPFWDSQPSVSADGQRIYFASSRPGGVGATDIWKATRRADGSWNTPQNLGPVINTAGREVSPFIHPDNQTLYFASDGHPGMGGLDIFYSRRDADGNWSKPVNLGYPLNTHGDEFALIVGASGEWAWFASEAEGGYGDSDLYRFRLYPEARPQPVSYMKGIVYDSITQKPLGASFELIDIESGQSIIASGSDGVDGSFLVAVPSGKNLALNVSKNGYLFFSEHFNYAYAKEQPEPYLKNIPLQPATEGQSTVLRNIFFETDSYRLEPSSFAELDRLVQFLEQNPAIHIEISGHTDSTGTLEYNLALSGNRARSVYNYLAGRGVAQQRMSYKGYADTRPVDTNDTEEGRARNRRTEFTILQNQ